jgi:hypothetical protein
MKTRRLLFAGTTALFAALVFAAPVLATLDSISGYAYGESVSVTPLGAALITSPPQPDAGPIGPGSGSDTGFLASVCVPVITCSVLSTGALNAATSGTTGASGTVSSTASVATVNALAGFLTATLIASECAVNSAGNTSGSSTLTNVVIQGVNGGAPLAANPGPNTTILLAGIGSVVLNEQFYTSGTNTLEVNAIHIYLTGGSLGTGEIIISHVECDALPGGTAPVIPESPLAILLPLSALVVVGGVLLVTLRRNAAIAGR